MSSQNAVAKVFRSLHVPKEPIVLANVYDAVTARAVASLPEARALATASYAIGAAAGVADADVTLEMNLAAVRAIASVAKEFNKPLTADWQDGYGGRLEEGISAVIEAGAVGINLEDFDGQKETMLPIDEAVDRIKRVLTVAKENGVPDFAVNARTDVLVHGGKLSEVITRGKAYLEAGATTVFVWGGRQRGTTKDEVIELTRAFEGKLNVSMRLTEGSLTLQELKDIGVARISIGPQLQPIAVEAFAKAAEKVLTGN
jgi:2-methylisocitrate lyase-like PEP mutase family enzyme